MSRVAGISDQCCPTEMSREGWSRWSTSWQSWWLMGSNTPCRICEAVDATLGAHRGTLEARGQLRDAVQALLALAPEGERRRLVLALEDW